MTKPASFDPANLRELVLSQVHLAADMIRSRHPLLGIIISCMMVVVDAGVATVHTAYAHGRIVLRVNPNWGISVKSSVLEGALLHEVNHIVLGHHSIDGAGLQPDLLDLAKDINANEYLDRPVPPNTATLKEFPGFPRGESVLERYHRLVRLRQSQDPVTCASLALGDVDPADTAQVIDDTRAHGESQVNDAQAKSQETIPGDASPKSSADPDQHNPSPADEDGTEETPPGDLDPSDAKTDKEDQQAQASEKSEAQPHGDAQAPGPGSTPGSGSTPGVEPKPGTGSTPGPSSSTTSNTPNPQASGAAARTGATSPDMQVDDLAEHPRAVALLVQSAAVHINPVTISQQETALLAQIPDIGVGRGIAPGQNESRLLAIDQDSAWVDWKRELRRYIGEALPVQQPSYSRPPRRLPHLLGIVPGSRGYPRTPVIQATVDTSGSMSDLALACIASELRFLAKGRRIMVVECDAKVQRIYRFSGRIERCLGRGGTDFAPALEPKVLRETKADMVVFFTDGDGSVPLKPPRKPVLWVLTTTAQPPAPWGDMIRMPITQPARR